jgi:hypothetical protein
MPQKPPEPIRLGDELGDYVLTIACRQCRHARAAEPRTLANIVGWEVALADLAKRLRCTKCGAKDCELTANRRPRPRGKDFR